MSKQSGHGFAARGAETPEDLKYTLPSKIEGAGKTGCALHPRSRRQLCIKKCAHEHTGSAENTRPPPRNGFTAYTSSPWWPAFLPPSSARAFALTRL